MNASSRKAARAAGTARAKGPAKSGAGKHTPSQEEALRAAHESEDRFMTLMESMPAVGFFHQNGRLLHVNGTGQAVLGYSLAELRQMDFWEVIHPDMREEVRQRGFQRQQGLAVPSRTQFAVITKDGQKRWLDCVASRAQWQGAAAVIGTGFDITESKRAEQHLRAQHTVACALSNLSAPHDWARQILQAIAEHLDWSYSALWQEDSKRGLLRCEATWHRGHEGLAAFAAASSAATFQKGEGLLGGVWATGQPTSADPTTDGHLPRSSAAKAGRLRTSLAFPLKFGGRVVGVVELCSREPRPSEDLVHVLTALGAQIGLSIERRRASEALRQSEERFTLFMRHLPGAAWMKDLCGRYLYANAMGEKIFHAPLRDLCGKTDEDLFPPATAAEFRRNDHLALSNGHEVRTIETLPQADGLRHSIVRKFPILDEGGIPVMVGGVAFDITERLIAEKRQRALGGLGHQLSMATTAEEAARTIVMVARDLLGWDACYLHLYSPQGAILPVLTIDTVDGQLVEFPSATFTLEPSPMMAHVIEHGGQLTLRDTANPVGDFVPFGDKARLSASLMHVPIRASAVTVGVLSIQSYKPQAYRPEDLETLQSLAEHCGGALERIRVVDTLRQSEARQRALLDALPDWLFRVRRDGTILDFKPRPGHDVAFPFPFAAARHLREVWPEPLVDQTLRSVEQTVATGATEIFEFEHQGPSHRCEFEARVVLSGADEALVIVRDVSEQARLEREILTISAREQERIGRDLHDGLGQVLTGIGLLARALEEKLQACCLNEASDATHLAQLTAHALSQSRMLARGLFPVALKTNGLLPALQELATSVERIFKISCSVEWNEVFQIANPTAEEHLYRLVQESVTNAVKHGKATQVRIGLACEQPGLTLTIRDNGSGIHDTPKSDQGMGLRLMHYRARRLGAQLIISSEPNGGTLVRCKIPRIGWSNAVPEPEPTS